MLAISRQQCVFHKGEGVKLMWTLVDRGRGQKPDFLVDVISGRPQIMSDGQNTLLNVDFYFHLLHSVHTRILQRLKLSAMPLCISNYAPFNI